MDKSKSQQHSPTGTHDSDTSDELASKPSKTAVKKFMHELQDLGRELVNLSPAQLKHLLGFSKITLSDELLTTMEQARKMPAGNAKRRQLQRVGKLLRTLDYPALQAAITDFKENAPRQSRVDNSLTKLSEAENWATQLMDPEKASTALSDFIQRYPHCDRQELRQLLRNSRKNTSGSKTTKHHRRLVKTVENILKNFDR